MKYETPLSKSGKRSLEHLVWLVETARKNRQIVDTPEELHCLVHKEARFARIGIIPGSLNAAQIGKEIYECEGCRAAGLCVPSRAYQCHNCGIAKGDPEERHFKTDDREGVNYFCGICGDPLGRDYHLLG